MRLIDADKLKSVIVENYRAEFFGSVLWDILNDIPTAYDVDKVVEEKDWDEYSKEENIKTILTFYSQIDGSHHKAWCLDQIARIVYGEEYQDFIHHYEYVDDDGVEHDEPIYEWDCGIAP